jgi:hypothetical protein
MVTSGPICIYAKFRTLAWATDASVANRNQPI